MTTEPLRLLQKENVTRHVTDPPGGLKMVRRCGAHE